MHVSGKAENLLVIYKITAGSLVTWGFVRGRCSALATFSLLSPHPGLISAMKYQLLLQHLL